jgi:hypothetical protein
VLRINFKLILARRHTSVVGRTCGANNAIWISDLPANALIQVSFVPL